MVYLICMSLRAPAVGQSTGRARLCPRRQRAWQRVSTGALRRKVWVVSASSSDVPSNLGQLGSLTSVTQLSQEDAALMLQRVQPGSFVDQGPYVDGASIFASGVLLLVLLAFSTNRIFGLERLFFSTARAWREEQRQAEVQKLQRMMDNNGPQDGGPPKDEAGQSDK